MGLTPTVIDGAIIETAWGNEIRDRTFQVFASAAERDAQWLTPPNGAICITLDTNYWFIRTAAGWVRQNANSSVGGSLSGDVNIGAPQAKDIVSYGLPTWPVASVITVQWQGYAGFGTGACTFTPYLTIWNPGQNTQQGKTIPVGGGVWVAFAQVHTLAVPANAALTVVGSVTFNTGFNMYINGGLTYQRQS